MVGEMRTRHWSDWFGPRPQLISNMDRAAQCEGCQVAKHNDDV